jgi:hypothetical protein
MSKMIRCDRCGKVIDWGITVSTEGRDRRYVHVDTVYNQMEWRLDYCGWCFSELEKLVNEFMATSKANG